MMSTSSPRSCGSRIRSRTFLAVSLCFALTAGSALSDDDPPELADLPIESEDQLRFFVDVSGFRGTDGKTELEIYTSITNDQLAFQPGPDSVLVGRLELGVTLRDASGDEVFSAESVLEPQARSERDAGDRAIVQALREVAVLDPGTYRLRVELRDGFALRTGLLNKIRRRFRSGRAEGWVEVRDFRGNEMKLSDLTLVRSFRVVGDDIVFGRHGVDFDPNPQRTYGLILPVARFYLEVYLGEDFEPGETLFLQCQVADAAGLPRSEKTTRATPRTNVFVVTEALPLAEGLTAGRYSLDVTVVRERTRESARTGEAFEVIWGVDSWGQDPEAARRELALIMSDAEHKTLESLSPGALEVYLAEFWHGLDPDPTTARNEVYDAFRARVRRADRDFASTLDRGIDTDRGRVWVRYGPPDDVRYQFSASGFGQSSEDRITDPVERADLSNRPSTSFLDPDEFREGDVSDAARQIGGTNIKAKQIEVWVYDGPGHPLTDRVSRDLNSHRGLKFIFADVMGDGNFRLIGSSGASIY